MTRGVKVPCATVTPSGKTDLADLTVSHFALATRVANVERIRDQSGRATADESGPETRREREPFPLVQCKLKPTSGESCPEKSNLDQHERRALEEAFHFCEVLGCDSAIDDAVIDAKGMVDVLKIRPIARMGYYDYTTVDSKFQMVIPGNSQALLAGLEGSGDKIAASR